MKKFLNPLLMLVVALAACIVLTPTHAQALPPTQTQAESMPYKGKVIEIYGMGTETSYTDFSQFTEQFTWMQKAAAVEWAEMNGVTLVFKGSYDQNALAVDIVSGGRPDLIYQANQFPHISNVGLTAAFTDSEYAKLAAICGNEWLDLMTYGTQSHGFVVPWTGTIMCYYNKTMFEDYGVKTPKEHFLAGDWTWEQFAETMKEMTCDIDANGTIDTYGLNGDSWNHIVNPWATNSKGELISVIDKPWMRDFFQLKYDAYTINRSTKAGKMNIQTNVIYPMFAMQFSDCPVYNFEYLYQYIPNGNELEVAPVPEWRGDNGDSLRTSMVTQQAFHMASTCDERAATVDLMAYILQCGLKYMADYSLGAVKCDYPGLQGTSQLSYNYLKAFEKMNKRRANELAELTVDGIYDAEYVKAMNEYLSCRSLYIKGQYTGVPLLTSYDEIINLTPEIAIAQISQKYQNALDTYNELYIASAQPSYCETYGHTYTNACDAYCDVCGDYRSISHDYNAATCTTPKTCKICGITSGSALAHTYKTTTAKATLSDNGSIVKKCTACGKVASATTIPYAKTFTLSTTSYTYNGNTKSPTVTVKDSAGKTLTKNTDYTVTYASGRVNVGSYTVTVKGIGNYSFTKTLTFKINPIKASNCAMKLSATSYTYNGSMKAPTVTVVSPTGSTLTKGTSYTVTYGSGRRNVGTYAVTVTMKGNYTGTRTLTFKINPAKASNCAAKLSATSYTYDGNLKAPTVTVKSPSGSTLTKGTSYTVTYGSGRRNVGTYTVTITMKGNYTGTKTLSFKINPAKASNCSAKLSATSYTYDGNLKTPTVTVKSPSGSTLTKGTSYTVTYGSGRRNVGTYKVTITMKGNYTGTKTLSFKINPAKASNCSMKLSATKYPYTGGIKAPSVTVKSPTGSTLTKGTSYTVSYASGRKNVGTYTVKVTMKGNYTGTKTLSFKIVPTTKASASLLVGQTFTIGAKSNKTITYSSSNSSIATVNTKGIITAKKAGTATITVKSGTVSQAIKVTVKTPYVTVSGTKSMVLKKSVTLKATTNTGATVKWSSANTSIATVSASGKVTGQKVGTTTIYAKVTYKGKTYTGKLAVRVTAPSLKLSTSVASVYLGDTYTLKATTDSGATIKFKSSNTAIATVSSSGRITPKAEGSVVITAYFTYAGTTYQRTCSLVVRKSNFYLAKKYILANGYTDSNGNKYIGMYDTADDGTRYNFAITYDASRDSLVFESWTDDTINMMMQFEFRESQSYIDVEMYFEYGSVAKASVTYSLDIDTYNNDSGFTYYIRTQGYLDPDAYKELIGSFNDLGFIGWELVLQYKVGITLNDLGFDSFYS